jgi:hypothetical protein
MFAVQHHWLTSYPQLIAAGCCRRSRTSRFLSRSRRLSIASVVRYQAGLHNSFMSKAEIVLEIIVLLQGTPLDNFARENFFADGNRTVVRCATNNAALATAEGQICKLSVATALRRYSYRFNMAQLAVLADLYVNALDNLEPEALVRVRDRMCDPSSNESQHDAMAARAVCDRLSLDF